MMDIFKKYKNLFIGVAVILMLFIGYSFFFNGNSDSTILSSTVTGGETSAADNELLLLLAELKAIRLNDALFQDQAFKSLNDFGLELVPEPSGRRNPFAPVGLE
jgi:hypothetical protein